MFGFPITPMVRALLLINIGVFALVALGLLPGDMLALRHFSSSQFRVYQIITSMFAHGGIGHLIGNMFGLFMFGPGLEKIWGPKRFLVFYLVCGIGASFIYTVANTIQFNNIEKSIAAYKQDPNPYSYELIINKKFQEYEPGNPFFFYNFPREFEKAPNNPYLIRTSVETLEKFYNGMIDRGLVGASGAVYGIILGFGLLFPNTVLMFIFFPFPIKAKYFVAIYGLFEVYQAFQRNPHDPVAHIAHLGGMIFAYLIIVYWRKKRDHFY